MHDLNPTAPAIPGRHWIFWALGCWLVALGLTFAAWVATTHAGPWSPAAEPFRLEGSRLALRGVGQVDGSRIVIQGPAPDGIALAAANLESPLDARNYRYVTVRASGPWPSGGLSFVWRVRGEESKVRRIELSPSGGRILPVVLGSVDGWTGSVIGVGVIARGGLGGPFAIESIELRPSSGWTTIDGIFSDWLEFEPWDGGSIHFMSGGNPALKNPLPLFLGISFAGAVGLYLFVIVLGHTRFDARVALAIALLGWAVIDTRWQLNLWRQLDMTRFQYAGKSWEAKRLAAEDGELFAFMRDAKARIGAAPAHVYVFADEEFDRMRGAYHLFPANVAALKGVRGLLPASAFKPGDVLVLYRKRGVEYDAGAKRLRWDENQALRADLLHVSKGSAVFRVLPPG